MYTRSDARWLADGIRVVYSATNAHELATATIGSMHEKFRASVTGCEESTRNFSTYAFHGARAEVPIPPEPHRYIHDHPIWAVFAAGNLPRLGQISRLMSRYRYEKTDHFNGLGRPVGIRDHIMVMSHSEDRFLSCSMFRDIPFTQNESNLLSLLQPHIRSSWLRVRASWKNSRRKISVRLSAAHCPQPISDEQYGYLKCYFPDWRNRGALPEALQGWVRRLVSRLDSREPSPVLVAHLAESARGKLYAHLLLEDVGFRIEFIEIPAEPDYSLLQAHGLTARECEVLHWLARGKRSSEIGSIISTASRTVDKHAERMRIKLGAKSRSAVVSAARARLGLC
jgi:DNA-binding CsgD family transcriptional regulator